MTTHLRAELLAAWKWTTAAGGAPGFGVIAEAYGRRLLRAPGAMAEDIGWPNATRAMAYLHRLAETPVTEAQARASATAIARADAAAAAGVGGVAGAPRQGPAPAITVATVAAPISVTAPAVSLSGPLQGNPTLSVHQRPSAPVPVFRPPSPAL